MPDSLPQPELDISDREAAILDQYGQLAERISQFFAELNLRAIPTWQLDGFGSCGGYDPEIEVEAIMHRAKNKEVMIALLGRLWRPFARAQVNSLICPYHEPGRGCRIPTRLRSPICLGFVEQNEFPIARLGLPDPDKLGDQLQLMLDTILHGPRLDGRFDPAENENFIRQSLGVVDLLIQQVRKLPPLEQAKQ